MSKRRSKNILERQLQLKTELIGTLKQQIDRLEHELRQTKAKLNAEIIRNTEILRQSGSINNDHRIQVEGLRHDVMQAELAFDKKNESYKLLKAKHDDLNKKHNLLSKFLDERDKYFNEVIERKDDEIRRLRDALQPIKMPKPSFVQRVVNYALYIKNAL